jgi:hypothetical protein
MRLFQVYSAGNFIEATPETPYFQVGESKYGKPVLDRVITPDTPLDEAAKCALVSMDSTLKSNLSVGLPLDLVVYEADSFQPPTRWSASTRTTPTSRCCTTTGAKKLREVFDSIEDPMWNGEQTDIPDGRRPAQQAAKHLRPAQAVFGSQALVAGLFAQQKVVQPVAQPHSEMRRDAVHQVGLRIDHPAGVMAVSQ